MTVLRALVIPPLLLLTLPFHVHSLTPAGAPALDRQAPVGALALGQVQTPIAANRIRRRSKRPDCPLECVCVENVVYCDGVYLRSLPRFLSPHTRAIYMRENQIRRLSYRRLRNLSEVRHLLLKGNKIRAIEYHAFQDMNKLISLSLTDNNLRSLPTNVFYALSHLKVLSLRHNRLTDIDDLFANGYNLQWLNLASNRIKSIGSDVFQNTRSLHIIDFHKNLISYIAPNAFINSPLLKYLILRENPLVELAFHFNPATQLQLLDVSHCQLERMVEGMPEVIDDLRLNDNRITQLDREDFKGVRKIRLLVLNNNRLQFIHQKALTALSELYDLYIGKNQLTEVPAVPSNIHAIYANYNNITRVLEGHFQFSTRLEFVFLRHNQISDIEETAFHGLRYVRSFDLSRNHIMMLKRYTFLYMTRLELLDLTNNPLEELEYGCFHGLRSLTILQLSSVGTKTKIIPSTFRDMQNVAFLDLSNSSTLVQNLAHMRFDLPPFSSVEDLNLMDDSLNMLPPEFPTYFPKLRIIKLVGNPWHCNKTIMWMVEWIRNSTVEIYAANYMTCASPPELKGRALQSLEPTELLYDIQSESQINLDDFNLIFEIIDNRNEGGTLRPGKLNLEIYPKDGGHFAELNSGPIAVHRDQSARHSHLNRFGQVISKHDTHGQSYKGKDERKQNSINKPVWPHGGGIPIEQTGGILLHSAPTLPSERADNPGQAMREEKDRGGTQATGHYVGNNEQTNSLQTGSIYDRQKEIQRQLELDKQRAAREEYERMRQERLSEARLEELRHGSTYHEVHRVGGGAIRNLYDDSSGFVESDEFIIV